MASCDQGYDDERFDHNVSQKFHCAICLNVIKDAVMCGENQHCFCRCCITRHLENFHNCPTCQQELTAETLTPVPAVFEQCLSELKIRCDYFERGCKGYVQLGDLAVHVKNCLFSRAIVCSSEGCTSEINDRNQRHEESEVCEFGKFKCHNCEETKNEIDQLRKSIGKINQDLHAMKIYNKGVTEKLDTLEIRGRVVMETVQKMTEEMSKNNEVQKKLGKEKEGNIQGMNTHVVILGGTDISDEPLRTVEMFEWSTMSWIPLPGMNQVRVGASSIVFNNEIIVNGGLSDLGNSKDMERFSYNYWSDFPAKLPFKLCGHSSMLYKDRLIVVGGCDDNGVVSDNIDEIALVQPYTTKQLIRMQEARCFHGTQLFDDKILICGGVTEWGKFDTAVDTVLMYDIKKRCFVQMRPLPYPVSSMATIRLGNNIILVGGVGKDEEVLKSAIIYNVKTENSHFLPDMKNKRYGCVAVVVKNNLIVMGGKDEKADNLSSVEKFSFDNYEWQDFPPNNEARWCATSLVLLK